MALDKIQRDAPYTEGQHSSVDLENINLRREKNNKLEQTQNLVSTFVTIVILSGNKTY